MSQHNTNRSHGLDYVFCPDCGHEVSITHTGKIRKHGDCPASGSEVTYDLADPAGWHLTPPDRSTSLDTWLAAIRPDLSEDLYAEGLHAIVRDRRDHHNGQCRCFPTPDSQGL